MKALTARQTWHSMRERCRPEDRGGRDAIIKVTACAICRSDLHLSRLASKCAH